MRAVLRKRPMTGAQLELARREVKRLAAEFLEQRKQHGWPRGEEDHRDPACYSTCLRSERQRENRHHQMLDRAPTGSDVLLELHQFDLFQKATTDSSDKRGDEAVKKFAVSQSDAAEKRDKQLAVLQKTIAAFGTQIAAIWRV